MTRVMVRYKVKRDRADENERYIKEVFAQLDRARPSGLHYASFKLPDGVSFVHLVSYDDGANADSRTALRELPAFKAFTAGIKDRCDEPPLAADLSEVGSYRMFDD